MNNGITPNARRLLWAGFFAILASGVGFAIRGGILADWKVEFGFTNTELGDINGAGFTGFCFGIIIGGLLADKIGYGKLVIAAFLFHVLSALVTFAAVPGTNRVDAYNYLYWGTFIFALANGTLEAVANPLVATLFPQNRTHYLNILHASWPGGLILGGTAGAVLGGTTPILGMNLHWPWRYQLGLFLVPVIFYGILFLGQHMPKSEASKKGLSLGEMMKDVGILGSLVACCLIALFCKDALKLADRMEYGEYVSYGIGGVLLLAAAIVTKFSPGAFLIFVLFIVHAMVGAVELGTDGWIQNITGNTLDPVTGKWLFVYTSTLMFLLRFCSDFIEKKLGFSPIAILLTCAILACIGLNLVSMATGTVMVMLALMVYAVGKTFFWPTMLAVVSDRYPRTGAIAISMMGGIGMMSAGLLGSPGLGYCKDRFASEALKETSPTLYQEYKADRPSKFLFFDEVYGLDGKKVEEIKQKEPTERAPQEKTVVESDIVGDRKTLKVDSFIPATMAVIYFLILLYFKAMGGYRTVTVAEEMAAET